MGVDQSISSKYDEDYMHLLAQPLGSKGIYGVGSHNSALAPQYGSEANERKSEDGILGVSEPSAYGSYL